MSGQEKSVLSHRQIWKLIAAVMLVQVFAQFVRSWLFIQLRDGGMHVRTAENLTYLVVVPFLVVMLLPVWRDCKTVVLDRLRLSQLTFRTVLIGIALGISLRIGVHGTTIAEAGFGLTASSRLDAMPGPKFDWTCPSTALVVLHIVSLGIVAAVTEEIVNRGWILSWLGRYGKTAAIAGSTLLFAIMHEPGTRAMYMPIVFGAYAALLAMNSGTLWGVVVAHSVTNSMVVLDWLCLRFQWNPVSVTTATRASGTIAILMAVFAFGFSALLATRRIAGPVPGDSSDSR